MGTAVTVGGGGGGSQKTGGGVERVEGGVCRQSLAYAAVSSQSHGPRFRDFLAVLSSSGQSDTPT